MTETTKKGKAPTMSIAVHEEEPFDLNSLIVEIIETSGSVDPYTLADEVLDKIADKDLRPALRAVLPGAVRVHMNVRRHHINRSIRNDDTDDDVSGNVSGNVRPLHRKVTGNSRWKAVGSLYLRAMSQGIYCGEAGYKALGDCTAADVNFAATSRFDKAKATAVEAQRFKLFATALAKHKVKTVSELPEIVVIEILKWTPNND